jgi:hypothetical protein
MKRKYVIGVIISGVSIVAIISLLASPVNFIEVGVWCHSKEPKLNELKEGLGVRFSMYQYILFLLNGEKLEQGNGVICTP